MLTHLRSLSHWLPIALLGLAHAREPGSAQREIPADLAAGVRRSETLGNEIFWNDRASARATDCLIQRLHTLDDKGLGAFVAVRESSEAGQPAERWLVSFTSDEEPPRVLHRVRIESGAQAPQYVDTPAPLPLPEALRPLLAARQLAIESAGPYEQPVNPVVLRGSDTGADDILVYLIAGTNKPDVAVLGRHVRVRVSKDGTKVLELAPLTKSIVELPAKMPDGKPVAALTISHVVSDFPSEAHVFASLLHERRIFVGTRRGAWSVEKGRVAYMGELAAPKAVLALKLRDPASGEARAGRVQLWRVGLPAEPGWDAGDERANDVQVPAEGLSIEGLAPGTYRANCDAHARSANPLPPFEVKAPRTEITLELSPPRERESWLDLVDASGQPTAQVEYKPGARDGELCVPAWVHVRTKIEADGTRTRTTLAGRKHGATSEVSWRKLERGARGFLLGREAEDGDFFETSRRFELRGPDGAALAGVLRFDSAGEQRLRGLLIEKRSLAGLVTRPDGTALDLDLLRVGTAVEPDLLPRKSDWWLDLPVRVRVNAPGCQPLSFEYRLRAGPPGARKLEKAR